MSEVMASSGSKKLSFINKNMLRVTNPAWGSRLAACANGDVRLHCGASSWGYSAELKLTGLTEFVENFLELQVKITMTVLRGNVSIGIIGNDGQFSSEFHDFPQKRKIVLPVSVRSPQANASLMVRNGTEANSIVRIHDISITSRSKKEGGGTDIRSSIDEENADFWSLICGSAQARQLGVTDFSPKSLKRFDDWFFSFYPYVFLHIPFSEMEGQDVLEVGLGYGTVSQRLAEWGARYKGLDIARGPVELVNRRLSQAGLAGEARVGSILEAPFESESFDCIVSIGCLHHTGDMGRSIDECWRLLRPGGQLLIMVYNAYSLRRWVQARRATATLWLHERLGYRGVLASASGERRSYDTNELGEEAPHLDVISITSLRHLFRGFDKFSARRENIAQEPPFAHRSRNELLKSFWPRIGGTDIYASARKTAWYWG
ncbi:MAG: class I SAM-dependent methyltransferase [Hyphomicrobiales bacterium]|nr:class I SAM-dependent methyltransferase [Hyphomicrobiales bacterium]